MPWAAAVTIGWTPSGLPVRPARYAATRDEALQLLEIMRSGKMPPRMHARKYVPERKGRSSNSRKRHVRNVPPRIRFLVLQRDGFACVYCGRHASPEVQLVVDHIIAFSKGGANDLANYATACFECNAGKSDLDASA